MSKIVFSDADPPLTVEEQAPQTNFIDTQQSQIRSGDAFQSLQGTVALLALSERVVTVPTGTSGFATEPDGTLWVEYTP